MKLPSLLPTLLTAVCCAVPASCVQAQQTSSPPQQELPIGSRYAPPPPPPEAPAILPDSPPGPTPAFDLSTLLQLACQYNPTLQQARLRVSAEVGKAVQAGLYPNPMFIYQGEQIFLDVPGDVDSPGEFQGGVIQQEIVTAGKLRLSRQKYMLRARVSEHQAMAQQFRVCNDVKIHFWRSLAASEIVRLRHELVKNAEDGVVTAQELYNEGQARRTEVRQANVALQRARLDSLTAQNDYDEQFRTLTSVVGILPTAGDVVGDLYADLPEISFDAALNRLLAESPELAAARAKLQVDQVTVAREQVEWVPNITASLGPGYNFDAKETTAAASVRMEIPLYDRNQGTIRQARADFARQRNEIQRIELRLRSELADNFRRYLTALQNAVEFSRMIVPETRAVYAELLESYREDRVAWPDVLEAYRDYADARIELVQHQLDARVQETLIAGFLLHNGLMAPEGPDPPGHIDAVPKPR